MTQSTPLQEQLKQAQQRASHRSMDIAVRIAEARQTASNGLRKNDSLSSARLAHHRSDAETPAWCTAEWV